jgi:hypothetical protein
MMRLGKAVLVAVATAVFPLTSAARPVEAQQQEAVRVPRSVLERYVGEYVYPDGATFRVGLEGDTLLQELPGRRLAYTPLSETLFMLGPNFTAEFVIDPAGGATQILSNGKSIEYRLRRKGSPPEPASTSPALSIPAVRVSRSVLERYVGVYEFIPGQMQRTDLRIVIRLEGDTLIRDGLGVKAILVPMSETRFRVGTTSFVAEFVVDEAGVTHVMGTGFQQMLARLKR